MDGSFDVIMQEVLKQQRIMEQLEEENRELRCQLTDLREGRGVFIQIGHQRFALASGAESNSPSIGPAPAPIEQVQAEPTEITEIQTLFSDVADAPTTMMAEVEIKAAAEAQKRVTAPLVMEEEQEDTFTPTFLEEIMIDEFASASTNKMAVWSGPMKKQEQPEITEEEKKAALRRELIGSFLLE